MRGVVLLVLLLAACSLNPLFASAETINVEEESRLNYLDGEGVVIAVADTGIDMDHSCFRNSTTDVGSPGNYHRKILHLNNTIDNWDNKGHQQFRHGTHIAGILGCDPLDGDENMTSMSKSAKLVIQDVVTSNGWEVPEDVTELLVESSKYGAVINSWSWGDNTVDYTNRSETIDSWTIENPWSLVFVAPGNTGSMVLEPSNAYNVVSVVASDSEENESLWPGNSHGPDINGRRGVLVAAPGVDIVSAEADGTMFGMNNGSREMTGTSMATPMAASFTALLQQLVEVEYGHTPSAPLLRAMLASSAEGVDDLAPNSMQGYGRPNLQSFENGFFVHDSYFIDNWTSLIEERGNSLSNLISNPWNGSGANGPFLSEGESWSRMLSPIKGEDVEVVMSYNARPSNYEIDDLRLIVHTSDGRFAVDDKISSSGYSQLFYPSFGGPLTKNSSNETTVMVRIPAEQVEDLDWIKVEIIANDIFNGSNVDYLGIEGTKLGFGLVATGVENLTQNTAPKISMLEGPNGGENYSESLNIKLGISDEENDSYIAVIRLNNSNYSIDLSDCTVSYSNNSEINCELVIAENLVLYSVNREDWRFEVVVVDDNSSVWTTPKISTFVTNNFSIWWTSPMIEDFDVSPVIEKDEGEKKNYTFVLGIVGVIFGTLVGASIMFRKFENLVLDDVPSPFKEEE